MNWTNGQGPIAWRSCLRRSLVDVHDWMHARAAKKAGVTVLLTDNFTDFQNLADGFTVEAP